MEQHLQHDLGLIAAYAEGLPVDDVAPRLVDECLDCRREYELQKAVKGLLGGLPPVLLTDQERSHLHAAIAGLPGGTVIALGDRRRAQRWMRVASVAAAAMVLVGLGAVYVGMMGGGSQGALTTTAGALAAGSSAESFESTTAAATSTTSETASDRYRLMPGGDAEAVRAEIDFMLEDSLSPAYGLDAQEDAAQREARCLEEVSQRDVLDIALSRLDGRTIVIFIVATEDGKEALVYDEATCLFVDIPPE